MTYVRHCKENLYVLCSTGNAYDVISYRRLFGPRAPQYFGQVYASVFNDSSYNFMSCSALYNALVHVAYAMGRY